MFLKISQNSQENTCATVSFLIKLQVWGQQVYQKETLAQVFSGEFCEVLKTPYEMGYHIIWESNGIIQIWDSANVFILKFKIFKKCSYKRI